MNILSCVFVIIGTIIGAGFASGKEIYTFFFIYGKNGILGLIISSAIIGLVIYRSLKIIKKYNLNSYEELLRKSIKNQNTKIGNIINSIINIYLLISFFIMCAGFSAYFKQEYEISQIYSILIITSFSYFILNKNMKGIIIINNIIIPIIIVLICILGVKNINIKINIQDNTEYYKCIIKAVLYASYNLVTLFAILIPMKKYIIHEKDIIKISILTLISILILSVIIFGLLSNIKSDINNIELPAVYAVRTIWISI